ncbi:hypothetical protein BCR37DRAFT_395293 [Protomyces lactucae-debilis]|uniref:Uncharacterized protein n=1 Tax=Protomyces lactucae-debilis TaxID=2754530 RepID=A0A1Y2EXN4_PROLT|nr:uncharacterized protein BCR37DRAFT_395293 [Protomyces lactucae-debilis]ORY76359.1 hypothetical protein BCR37DRAFT_395293 [Protomyces lactucae-debilis]
MAAPKLVDGHTDTADHGSELASSQAKQWIKETVDAECARIKEAGSRAIPLPLKNCGVVLEELDGKDTNKSGRTKKRKLKVINRLEIASGMDFNRVSQIMLSEPLPYPFKEGYEYVHVLAFTQSSNEMALLIPYLYAPYLTSTGEEAVPAKKSDKDSFVNTLQDWLFLNEKHERSLHHIDAFHSIS